MNKISLKRTIIIFIEKIFYYLFFFTKNIKSKRNFLPPYQDILKVKLKSSKNKLNFKVKSNIDLLKIRFYSSVNKNFYSEYIYFQKQNFVSTKFLNKIEQIDFINLCPCQKKHIFIYNIKKFLIKKKFRKFFQRNLK